MRPNGQAWFDLVTKTWWTSADGRTAADGSFQTRGFYSDYEVTVSHGGRTKVERLMLRPGGTTQTVKLP